MTLKRRQLIQGAAAAAVLGAPHLKGFAQQSVTLKFHTFMAPLSNVWLLMHKPWMEKVEKDSGGRIKFEAYPAMQLGGTPVQLYDQARDGVVDIVWTLPGNNAGRFPRIEVFELPFMMNNAEATSKLRRVVDIEEPATGKVRLKKQVDKLDEMALDTASTKTTRVRK